MKLYIVQCFGEVTNWQHSIVTIWKTKEEAERAKEQYINNNAPSICPEYTVDEIDTDEIDTNNNCVYDYEWYD